MERSRAFDMQTCRKMSQESGLEPTRKNLANISLETPRILCSGWRFNNSSDNVHHEGLLQTLQLGDAHVFSRNFGTKLIKLNHDSNKTNLNKDKLYVCLKNDKMFRHI